MTFRKSILITIIIVIGSLGILSNSVAYDQFEDNLDSEELIHIAKSYPEVATWLETHELLETNVRLYIYSLWEIILTTKMNATKLVDIIVTIDDATATVNGVSYLSYDVGRLYDSESEIVAQGLEFFKNDSNYQYFVDNNYDIGAGIDDANILRIWGRNGTNWVNRLNFHVDVAFIATAIGEYSFNKIKITSDEKFGDMILDSEDVKSILENETEVNDFKSQYEEHDERIQAVLYYDNPIHGHQTGYFYEVEYYGEMSYFEYINNQIISVDNDEIGSRFDEFVNLITVSSNSISIEVNASNGEIINIDGQFMRSHELDEVLEIAFQDSEINEWIEDIIRFEGELLYDVGSIYVLTINPALTSGFGRFIINDTSGMVIENKIKRFTTAVNTADYVYSSVIKQGEVVDFFELNEVVNHTILYDTIGTWIIEFYNPIIPQNTAVVKFNDSSGEILDVSISVLEIQPKLQISDIISQVLASNSHEHYFIYPESEIVFYYNVVGYWSIYIYSTIFPENYYRILVDDETKEVYSEAKYQYATFNQTSLNEASVKLNDIQMIMEFKQNYGEVYETIYFDGNWVYYAEALQSQLLLNQLTITLNDDLELDASLTEQRVIGNSYVNFDNHVYHHNREFRNYQKVVNTKFVEIKDNHNYYLLDKLFTYSVSELIGNDNNPGNVDDNSSGDNGFGVSINVGIGVVGLIVTIILVKYAKKGVTK